jgi:hypothetical protein
MLLVLFDLDNAQVGVFIQRKKAQTTVKVLASWNFHWHQIVPISSRAYSRHRVLAKEDHQFYCTNRWFA